MNKYGRVRKKTKRAKLLPPKGGVSYTLGDTFLTNKENERPPVEYWLFMERVIGKNKSRFLHEISAATQELADAELRAIGSRDDVELVDDKTRHSISKDWKEPAA